MNQRQKRKMEAEQKTSFITNAYATVLSCIAEQSKAVRASVQIRLTHQRLNRYVRFHAYGKDMNIQIFGDGNVAIELKEALHNEHREQLFEYTSETEVQDAFLAALREMVSWLIPVFLDLAIHDYHTYMDYVSDAKGVEEAYRQMVEESRGISAHTDEGETAHDGGKAQSC